MMDAQQYIALGIVVFLFWLCCLSRPERARQRYERFPPTPPGQYRIDCEQKCTLTIGDAYEAPQITSDLDVLEMESLAREARKIVAGELK